MICNPSFLYVKPSRITWLRTHEKTFWWFEDVLSIKTSSMLNLAHAMSEEDHWVTVKRSFTPPNGGEPGTTMHY